MDWIVIMPPERGMHNQTNIPNLLVVIPWASLLPLPDNLLWRHFYVMLSKLQLQMIARNCNLLLKLYHTLKITACSQTWHFNGSPVHKRHNNCKFQVHCAYVMLLSNSLTLSWNGFNAHSFSLTPYFMWPALHTTHFVCVYLLFTNK